MGFDSAGAAEPYVEYRLPHLLQLRDSVRPAARLRALLSLQGKQAFTYGWDTAFAIRLPDANAAIIKAGSSPKTFSQVAPDDSSVSTNGTFGPWQICRGGDGILIHFAIPITTGTVSYSGNNYAMAGAVATIEVKLTHIPPQPTTGKPPPSTHKLVVRTVSANPTDDPVVSVIDLTVPVDPGLIPRSCMKGLLEIWFNAHLEDFAHVFNTITLNRMVAQAQFQWLAPTHTSYAYANGATDDTSILGVLCMTQQRSAGSIASQLSPNAIPPGARSGVLIARERFLDQMVLPALPKVFPGSSAASFALSVDKNAVINVANVNTKTVTIHDTPYQPVLTSLYISVSGDEIVVSSITRVDIMLGTYCEVTATTYQRLKLATKPDGTQTLVYEKSREPISDHAIKSTAEGDALKAILALAGLMITAVLSVLTEGALLVVALIIVGLLVGLLEALPALIANVVGNKVSNDSPSLALLVSNSTDPIQWPGGSAFVLSWAGMNDSLQLGGNPGFA